jgi:hypothetical protein
VAQHVHLVWAVRSGGHRGLTALCVLWQLCALWRPVPGLWVVVWIQQACSSWRQCRSGCAVGTGLCCAVHTVIGCGWHSWDVKRVRQVGSARFERPGVVCAADIELVGRARPWVCARDGWQMVCGCGGRGVVGWLAGVAGWLGCRWVCAGRVLPGRVRTTTYLYTSHAQTYMGINPTASACSWTLPAAGVSPERV